jgi:NADPH:quinone reductase-like Zn-dependent oxidoreductase
MLTAKAGLRAGESVLVQAGGSGVSIAAIQMAKLLGASVVTTVGSAEKAAKARALGADAVILYREQDVVEEARKHVGKRGFDVIVDHVGADTFATSLRLLARGGRLVTCGATTGGEVKIDLKAIFFKNLSILGSTMGSKADLLRIVSLVAAGKLRPVVDSRLPMSSLPQALERLERRDVFGKLVLLAEDGAGA